MANGHRSIENALAVGGAVIGAGYVVTAEILPPLHCAMPIHAGLPWGVVIIVGILVAPKTVGRATTGRIWESVTARFAPKADK